MHATEPAAVAVPAGLEAPAAAASARLTLAERVVAGERAAVARAISLVEQRRPGAEALAAALAAHRGRAFVLGITGAPGAGKSTLVHALLGELIARGRRTGVVAVDPSSPITGGAVLGDRVRMGEHGAHESVFIRSLASRGELGGLVRHAAAVVDILDAAGFDTVIVETVGTGQSEIDILHLADVRIVVCPPGLGDDVQALKAGILEIADVLAVSKGDLPAAAMTARELMETQRLRRGGAAPVLATSAARGDGIAALLDAAEALVATRGRGQRLRTGASGRPGSPAAAAVAPPVAPPVADGDAAAHVARLAAADALCTQLGISLLAAGEGTATLALTVRPEHLNFNGGCHGGVIFSLADSAFGLASNSRGKVASGIDAHITYNRGARLGDRLVATATEAARTRQIATYRIDVTCGDQRLSTFTGTVFVTDKPWPGPPA